MGTLLWRKRKDGTERLVVQWVDASGATKQKTIPDRALDGSTVTRRVLERDGRRRLAEMELEVDRQRAGLAPISSDVLKHSLRSLIAWWWEQRGKALKSPSIRAFVEKHSAPLLDEQLRAITPSRLARLLHTDLEGVLSPKSRKHLRAYFYNVFEEARRTGSPWHGRANPIDEVPPVKVPKSPRAILQPEEMEPVLEHVPERWRGPVATALFAGLREGEVFGLRKQEVDLAGGVLWVARSWEAPRTKDGKPAPIPIAPALRPLLEEALKSHGEFLFPQPDGTMYPRTLRLGKMLRRALVRAGLVIGYEHRCRAWKCGWKARRATARVPDVCPQCGKATTWAKPIPRHVRFHDTRHSFGTQLVRTAGVGVAQKALRHSDVRLTTDTYGHLDLDDLRQGIMRAFPEAPAGAPPPRRLRAVKE